jgi:ABC-2 type transport system permease protein
MSGLAATRIILGAEALAFRHRLLKRGPVRLAVLAIALVAAVVFIGGGAFAIGAGAGRFLASAVDTVLVGGFTSLSVLMLVVGFPTVIATFFVGRDLLQLTLAPVRTVEIFAARLILAMGANLLISFILGAVVLGVGVGTGAPLAYFLLAVPLIFLQVLIITSLQTILMSIILRWVPARMARDVAAAAAGLTGAGLYLAWNVSLRQSLVGRTRPNLDNLDTFVQRIDWLPPAWPGHAMSAMIAGNAPAAAMWVGLTLLLAAVTLGAAEVLYERTLVSGLGVFGNTQPIWSRKARRQGVPSGRGAASPALAIARKDWLGFRRDIRRLSRLLPALLFPIGYVFAVSRPSRGANGFWTEVFLVGFMSMFMSTTLATPAVPSERRGFLLLRMAPLTMWQVLRAKVLLTLPPVLAMTIVFSVVVGLVSNNGPDRILELGTLVIWLGCGFVAIGVSAGGIDPRFEALDDRRAIGLVGTLAGIGGSLGFGLLSVGALALFVFGAEAFTGSANLGPIPSTPEVGTLMWVAGVILAAGSLAVVVLLLWLANSRLRSFETAIPNS